MDEGMIVVGEAGPELLVTGNLRVCGAGEISGELAVSGGYDSGVVAAWPIAPPPSIGWWTINAHELGRIVDKAVGLVSLAEKVAPSRELAPFPALALRDGPGTAPLLF